MSLCKIHYTVNLTMVTVIDSVPSFFYRTLQIFIQTNPPGIRYVACGHVRVKLITECASQSGFEYLAFES